MKILKSKLFIIFLVIVVLLCFLAIFKDKILKFIYPRTYSEIVSVYAEKYQVDSNLIFAVIKAESNFKSTMEALFHGMDNVISSKTVVGEAIHVKDTIILPLVDVSFSVGAGSFTADKNEKGAGGLGGKMTPCAVLVIQNGTTRLVNIKNQDTITKILDMVPDLVERFRTRDENKVTEEEVNEILDEGKKENE